VVAVGHSGVGTADRLAEAGRRASKASTASPSETLPCRLSREREVPVAYDEELAVRIRAAVADAAGPTGYREIAMFGGLCWTVNTHMAVGTGASDLMVHVGKEGLEEALANGARPATMGDRTMGGVVLVAAADLPDADALAAWVGPAVERAQARPPKKSKQ
jgi:hypothetical protein